MMKSKRKRLPGVISCVILLALFAGCGGPESLLDAQIKAGSSAAFLHWRGRVLETYPKPQRTEFEEALQELRFVEMGRGAALSSSAIDSQVRERIDGRRVRDVLTLAYEARWKRVDEELKLLRGVIEVNMAKTPLTAEGANRLETNLDRQVKRQDELSAELARIETRLEELGARPAPSSTSAPGAPGRPMSGGSGAAV